MKNADLKKVIQLHQLWINDFNQGKRADLEGANLRGANLQGANLQGANLRGANLRYADLRDANLEFANLEDANLRYADLEFANLEGANLRGANLQGANLRGANLEFANLEGALFQFATGDNFTLFTVQAGRYHVVLRREGLAIVEMAIGCEQHFLRDWWTFNDNQITRMDSPSPLDWWLIWKPILRTICEQIPRSFAEQE